MDVYSVIKKLSPLEIKLVKSALEFEMQGNLLERELKFFEHVVKSPSELISDETIMKYLWNDATESALTKLKSRVFIKILDVLVSDNFIDNVGLIENTERGQLKVRKRMLQFRVLYRKINKTDIEVLSHLLKEIIIGAKEYELYDVLIEALNSRKYIYARLGYEEFVKQQKEIEYYSNCQRAMTNAVDAYFMIISNQKLISHFSEPEMEDFIETKIREIETDPCMNSSASIQWYYKILKLAQFQKNKMHQESIDTCLDLINLLDKNKAVSRKERYGFVYDNLSECLVLNGKFKDGAQTSRQAQTFYSSDSYAYIISKEQEFSACFYDKDLKCCKEIMKILLNHSQRDTGEVRHDKFIYYDGCVDFEMGDYKQALTVCNLALKITKDKFGWELGIRYLKIMSLVEIGEIQEAYNALESLRKQLTRNVENADISVRDKEIYTALLAYQKCGFRKEVNAKLAASLEKLSETDTIYSWKLYSHELIPVHDWLKKRISIKKPQHKELVEV